MFLFLLLPVLGLKGINFTTRHTRLSFARGLKHMVIFGLVGGWKGAKELGVPKSVVFKES